MVRGWAAIGLPAVEATMSTTHRELVTVIICRDRSSNRKDRPCGLQRDSSDRRGRGHDREWGDDMNGGSHDRVIKVPKITWREGSCASWKGL